MQAMKRMLRPGELLYLAIPIGTDLIYWNGKRIYGRIRLPLLLNGWRTVDRFGYHDGLLDSNGHVQPVFVLRNER